MEKILLCTKNLGKVNEFIKIFKENNIDIELVSLFDLNDEEEVEETGNSFEENSYLKASFYFNKYHLPVLADDSGLCINYLNGEPGINSARFSGLGPIGNIEKVLKLLNGVEDRSAFFITDLCYIDKQGKVSHYVGKVKGFIGKDLEGTNGFGYDPIFRVNYNGKIKSFASLGVDVKNKMSHRYNAVMAFLQMYKHR